MTEFETVCSTNRDRIKKLPLDQQYQQTLHYANTVYYYDPDYDCFYPYVDPDSLSLWDRWGWIGVIALLVVLVWATGG
jgi:hypothetical protein